MHLGLIHTINTQLNKDVNIIFVNPIKQKWFLGRKWTLYRVNNRKSEGFLKTKSFQAHLKCWGREQKHWWGNTSVGELSATCKGLLLCMFGYFSECSWGGVAGNVARGKKSRTSAAVCLIIHLYSAGDTPKQNISRGMLQRENLRIYWFLKWNCLFF